jgi:hypothetical protein
MPPKPTLEKSKTKMLEKIGAYFKTSSVENSMNLRAHERKKNNSLARKLMVTFNE